MTSRILALCGVALVLVPGFGSATTVVPVSFEDLIARSELIFAGQVIDRRSTYLRGPDAPIVTDVTFDVLRVLKGSAGLRTQLTFLGGTVGRDTLIVSGMPQFEVGERDMLFVSADRIASSPLVGFWQGRFRIVRDSITGRDLIRTSSGGPVFHGLRPSNPSPAVRRLGPGQSAGAGLSVDEFETLVRSRLRR